MKFSLRDVPPDGDLHLEGELPAPNVLALAPDEPIKPLSPLRYDLAVGTNEESVWATGQVSVDLQLECVRCLEKFRYPVDLPDLALHTDRPAGDTVDLTPLVREDIILALPSYPHCDWSGERVCPHLPAVAPGKPSPLAPVPVEEANGRENPVWDSLDRLKISPPDTK